MCYLWCCLCPGCAWLKRRGKFSTNLSPSGRIRQVQNTTSCHNSGTMNLNSIRISTVRGHAPYKYPSRNTMPKSPGTNSNPLRISWSDTSFSPTVGGDWEGLSEELVGWGRRGVGKRGRESEEEEEGRRRGGKKRKEGRGMEGEDRPQVVGSMSTLDKSEFLSPSMSTLDKTERSVRCMCGP